MDRRWGAGPPNQPRSPPRPRPKRAPNAAPVQFVPDAPVCPRWNGPLPHPRQRLRAQHTTHPHIFPLAHAHARLAPAPGADRPGEKPVYLCSRESAGGGVARPLGPRFLLYAALRSPPPALLAGLAASTCTIRTPAHPRTKKEKKSSWVSSVFAVVGQVCLFCARLLRLHPSPLGPRREPN